MATPPPIPRQRSRARVVILSIIGTIFLVLIIGIFIVLNDGSEKALGIYRHQYDDDSAQGYVYIVLDKYYEGYIYVNYIDSFSGDTVRGRSQDIQWDYDKKTGVIHARVGRAEYPSHMSQEDWPLRGDSLYRYSGIMVFSRVDSLPSNLTL